MIVATPYVYTDGRTAPGIARVDIDAKARLQACLANDEIAAPKWVPRCLQRPGSRISTRKVRLTGLDVYYWTAVDFRTGDSLGAADRHRIAIRHLCAGAGDRTRRRAVRAV